MNAPEPNLPLLRKAIDWAEAEAAKTDGTGLWKQSDWAAALDCGTAFCIAGFAVMNGVPGAQMVPEGGSFGLTVDGKRAFWSNTGEQVLGLTWQEAAYLFSNKNTIADVRRIAEQIAARGGERL